MSYGEAFVLIIEVRLIFLVSLFNLGRLKEEEEEEAENGGEVEDNEVEDDDDVIDNEGDEYMRHLEKAVRWTSVSRICF